MLYWSSDVVIFLYIYAGSEEDGSDDGEEGEGGEGRKRKKKSMFIVYLYQNI